MDTKLASARFVRLFAISFILLCIVVGAFNALVDPYGIFGSPRIPGFNALKPQAAERVRVAKPYMAEAYKARTVIGGNSRPEMGLDPASPCWNPEHQPVFNTGIPGASFRLQTDYVRHAVVATGATRVVLGLDFIDFLVDTRSIRGQVDWNRPPQGDALRLTKGSTNPAPFRSAIQRIQDRFNGLLSLETLADSLLTIGAQHAADVSTRRNDGFNPARDYLPIIRTEGQSVLFTQKNRELAKSLARPGLGLYNIAGHSSEPLEALENFLQWAAERKVDVALFINPYHANYLALIGASGHWDTLGQWKANVFAIASRHSVPIWDFNDLGAMATESPPPPGNRKDMLHWYWEPAHYRRELGDLMLNAMDGTECASAGLKPLIGTLLTKESITAHQAKLAAELTSYRKSIHGEQNMPLELFMRDD